MVYFARMAHDGFKNGGRVARCVAVVERRGLQRGRVLEHRDGMVPVSGAAAGA